MGAYRAISSIDIRSWYLIGNLSENLVLGLEVLQPVFFRKFLCIRGTSRKGALWWQLLPCSWCLVRVLSGNVPLVIYYHPEFFREFVCIRSTARKVVLWCNLISCYLLLIPNTIFQRETTSVCLGITVQFVLFRKFLCNRSTTRRGLYRGSSVLICSCCRVRNFNYEFLLILEMLQV